VLFTRNDIWLSLLKQCASENLSKHKLINKERKIVCSLKKIIYCM